MDLIGLVGIAAFLFLVIGLSEPLAALLRVPDSVILAGVGILIGAGAVFFLRTDLTDALNPISILIIGLPIRATVFLYVFLPTLLFQVTLGLNLRRMLDDWVPILTLAAVAVVAATVLIGLALYGVTGLSLAACLLIGSIVSTTDPSAVVGVFRSIAAPQRLTRIVEGESLLNDAAAIALFGLFLGLVTSGTIEAGDLRLGPALSVFPWLIGGGVLVGAMVAWAGVWLMGLVRRHPMAQLTISIALPYIAYITSEEGVGASGVMGVVAAGLVLNLVGPGRLSPGVWQALRELWDLLAHWAGSLIFVLAALLIPRLLHGVTLSDVGLICVVTLAATLARALILFGLLPLLSLLRLSPRVEPRFRLVILWGGLRGAVTLALALAVTENAAVPPEIKRLVGILATGFVLFTLVAQGTTLRPVIRWLGLDRLSPRDLALADQVVAVALQNVREGVAEVATKHELSREIVRAEAKAFGERLDHAVHAAEEGTEILDRDRITLGLVTLAGRERELILEGFRHKVVSAGLVEQMLANAERVIEGTRTEGRTGYLSAGRRALAYGPGYRLGLILQRRLRLPGLLARLSADRFEVMLTGRLILRDLHGFIDAKIRRIHGRRVAELLHDLLSRREEEMELALEGLRLQFPGYAEELERRFLRRLALRLEEREYEGIHADGLIGPELLQRLTGEVSDAEDRAERRPALDLAVQKGELVQGYPLFAHMDAGQRQRLTRALETRYVEPGEVLVRKGERGSSVFFIASGAVEVTGPGPVTRLGRGEMFGQFTALTRRESRSEARAITHGTLLALGEARFLALAGRDAELRAAVLQSAAKRGFSVEGLFDQPAPARRPFWTRLLRRV